MFRSNSGCGWQNVYFRHTLGLAVRAALVCLLLWPGRFVVAQTAATGALKGTVTDPSGRGISVASVKVTSLATGQPRTEITQNNGSYLVPYLDPVTLEPDALAKGFK